MCRFEYEIVGLVLTWHKITEKTILLVSILSCCVLRECVDSELPARNMTLATTITAVNFSNKFNVYETIFHGIREVFKNIARGTTDPGY